MSQPWLSVTESAQYLGVSKGTIYAWVARRDIPAHKLGRLWEFKASEVDIWIRSERAGDRSSLDDGPDGQCSTHSPDRT